MMLVIGIDSRDSRKTLDHGIMGTRLTSRLYPDPHHGQARSQAILDFVGEQAHVTPYGARYAAELRREQINSRMARPNMQ